MNFVKWLLVAGVLGLSWQWWQRHEAAQLEAVLGQPSPGGFLRTAMPEEARHGTVLVLAPVNCPSEAAQRADALARELEGMGIPVQRLNHFSIDGTYSNDEQKLALEHTNKVFQGEIPAVFVNGMGKANPTADEVADEYRRTN